MSDNVVYPDFPPKPGTSGTRKESSQAQVAEGGGGPHDPGMEARVAVLEQIAKVTAEALGDIKSDLRSMRDKHDTDFRITIGLGAVAFAATIGLMAKGFHWLP